MTVLFAQADSGSPLEFVQYGVLGLVIVALLLGWLWAKPGVDELRTRAERAEAQRDALMDTMQKEVLPVLAQTSQVNEAMRPVLAEVIKVLDDIRPETPRRSRG